MNSAVIVRGDHTALNSVAALAKEPSMVSQTGISQCASCAARVPERVRDLNEVTLDMRFAAGLKGSP